MNKFEVGDHVRIIEDLYREDDIFINKIGTIIEIDKNKPIYPYTVTLLDKNGDSRVRTFKDEELQLITNDKQKICSIKIDIFQNGDIKINKEDNENE